MGVLTDEGSLRFLRFAPREEKTEQLGDTKHEVDQLVLELQKVKQEVSTRACAHVQGEGLVVAGAPR